MIVSGGQQSDSAIHIRVSAAAVKSLQSCPTLCDPIDSSPAGSPVPGILQARTPEWVAISFSNAWKGKVKVKPLSRIRLLATPWTAAHQAPPSMRFSRQEYWNGVPLRSPYMYLFSPKFLSHPGIYRFFFFLIYSLKGFQIHLFHEDLIEIVNIIIPSTGRMIHSSQSIFMCVIPLCHLIPFHSGPEIRRDIYCYFIEE